MVETGCWWAAVRTVDSSRGATGRDPHDREENWLDTWLPIKTRKRLRFFRRRAVFTNSLECFLLHRDCSIARVHRIKLMRTTDGKNQPQGAPLDWGTSARARLVRLPRLMRPQTPALESVRNQASYALPSAHARIR